MVQAHSTTAPTVGKWRISLKQQTCEACGRMIPTHEHFLRFPYFEGREHTVACVPCALGPEPSGPSLPVFASLAKVAA